MEEFKEKMTSDPCYTLLADKEKHVIIIIFVLYNILYYILFIKLRDQNRENVTIIRMVPKVRFKFFFAFVSFVMSFQ